MGDYNRLHRRGHGFTYRDCQSYTAAYSTSYAKPLGRKVMARTVGWGRLATRTTLFVGKGPSRQHTFSRCILGCLDHPTSPSCAVGLQDTPRGVPASPDTSSLVHSSKCSIFFLGRDQPTGDSSLCSFSFSLGLGTWSCLSSYWSATCCSG